MSQAIEERFGRYALLEELSRGGMGRVYRARMEVGSGLSKQVALKRLLREVNTDAEFVARFTDEARIACSLSHANIVQVFDFGREKDEYYLTMEFVDGVDLSRLIAAARRHDTTIPLAAALFIATGMCRGLGAAHRRVDEQGQPAPVVHRDVSPHKVLVSRGGDVKVADFGIATAAERAMRTRTGLILGKCRYLSPEQVLGTPVDARADVFACGCVLFELLSSRPFLEVDTPKEALRLLASGPLPALDQACGAGPPALRALLQRSLERDADARYPHATAMAKDVESVLREVSPAYSSDDLALLVGRWFPSAASGPHQSKGVAVAPTLPSPQPGTPPSEASSDLAHAPTAATPEDAHTEQDLAPGIHSAPTHLIDRAASATEATGTELDPLGSWGAGPADITPSVGIPRSTRRPTLLRVAVTCLVLALLGAALGTVVRDLLRSDTEVPTAAQLGRGTSYTIGGWTVGLRSSEEVSSDDPRRRRLLLNLELSHPARRLAASAQPFRFGQAAAKASTVVFWRWTAPTRLQLLLEVPDRLFQRDEIQLRFDPGGGAQPALFALAVR